VSAGNKCKAPADLRAGADDYKEVLQENCDAIIESQDCFAEAAGQLNSSLDNLSFFGNNKLSGGETIDELLGGTISEASSMKINSVGADGKRKKGDKLDNELGNDIVRWQTGTETEDSGRLKAGDPASRYTDYSTSIGEEAAKAQRANAGRRGATKLFDNSGRTLASKTVDGGTLKERIDELAQKLKSEGAPQSDIEALKGASRAADAAESAVTSPGLTSCAEKYDEIEQELQNAAGAGIGTALAHGGGTGEERAAAAEALAREADPTQRTVFVDSEIEYKEECIILSQVVPLAKYHRDLTLTPGPKRARLPYEPNMGGLRIGNAPLLVDGEAYGFINRLTQTESYKDLFNMPTSDIAALQPLIRLFKVVESEDSIVEHEISFDSFASDQYNDVTDIFQNKARRGFGVGIKSFNLTFDGQDMFAASRTIKATLKLQANSFDEFLKERISNPRDSKEKAQIYRYIELALKTGGKKIEKYSTFENDLSFRLKAVFGYNPHVKNIKTSSGALNESFVSVNLTPVTHNFDFDEQGRVTFTIEYYAYIEEALSKPNLNIFTEPYVFSKILARQLAYNTLELNAACDLASKDEQESAKAEREKEDAKAVEREKICMMNHLMTQLFREDKIYILKLTRPELRMLVEQGPHFKFDSDQVKVGSNDSAENLSDDLTKLWETLQEDDKQVSGVESSIISDPWVNAVQIPFLYAGDIIDIIVGEMTSFLETTRELVAQSQEFEGLPYDPELKGLELNNLTALIDQYKKFRLTLGPLELYDYTKQRYANVNFADVPISVAQFTEFLTSKLLQKDQAIYPLTQFLKDFFNLLIKNYLNKSTCKGINVKQKTRLFESCVTSYGMDLGKGKVKDRITHRIQMGMEQNNLGPRLFVTNNRKAVSILNISGKAQFKNPNEGYGKEFNHFIFYAGRVQPTNLMNGNQSEDEQRGIFHYLLGKNTGIVKNIQLRKTNSPGLKEVRFESEGMRGLTQLYELYDVEIDSYANVRAFPGTYIFVDPQGFAPNLAAYGKDFDLTDIGIGGYYMIIRSQHEFAPGTANTKLTAVWVHSKNPQSDKSVVEQGGGQNTTVKGKCNAKRKKLGLYENAAVSGIDESTFASAKKDQVSTPPSGDN